MQYYSFKYKCDDCQYSYFNYTQISGLNTTSTNVSVSRGTRWTAMLRVSTRYGSGKYDQTTVVACPLAVLKPVTDLEARLDDHNKTLVHLTWKAPLDIGIVQVQTKTFQGHPTTIFGK